MPYSSLALDGYPADSSWGPGRRFVIQALRALILLLLCLSPTGRASAQNPPVLPGGIEEAVPPTRYLKDEKGNLVPVPGFSYEHYRDLVLQAERTGTEPPPFSVEKLTLKGAADEDIYRFDLDIVVKVRKAGWVMVPIRLPRAVLREAITGSVDPKSAPATGREEFIHRFDAKEGHVLWLWGEKERRHSLRLPLSTELTRSADEQQLSLALPKASESHLTLESDERIANAVLKTGDGLVETTSRESRSQVLVTGASGELMLAWRSEESQPARVLDLDASSEIAVNVETRDTMGFSAKLRVSRAGGTVRRLFVRLPPQTELAPRPARGFTTAVATAEELSEAGFDPQRLANDVVARVDFEKPSETCEFTLDAVFKPSAVGQRAAVESAGFDVLGAGRQVGFVSVHVPPGWSLKATPNAAVFRTDEDPTLLAQNRPTARYRFVRQPFALQLDIAPQPPRTVVEPTYVATVQAQRVTLAATLDYQVRGPRPAFVEINLGDWRIDSAGPESLVDFEQPAAGETARLNLQPSAKDEFSLQLQLHRDVPADNLELAFGLPQPVATQALSATLVVVAADNVALTPHNDDIRSLVQESRASQLTPGLGGRTLVYRELPAGSEPPRFVANCQVRKRRVTAAITGRAQIAALRADVEQSLSLQVAYEPLSVVMLDAPANDALADLRVSHNGQLLDVREESLVATANALSRRWRVELLEPVLGTIDLNVRYRLALPKGEHLQLPLVSIAEEDGVVTARQQLTLSTQGAIPESLVPNQTDDPGLSTSESPEGLVMTWPRRAVMLELDRMVAGRNSAQILSVERQWLQIWLSPLSRRDRLVAQIAGLGEQFRIALPVGVEAENITALVDGQPPQSLRFEGQSLVISTDSPRHRLRTLELWYLLPESTTSPNPQQRILELPKINGAAAPTQCWVQVLTPANEQVLYSPSPVTAEQSWRKRGWLWQRSGALTTRELEAWSGASQADDTPAETNEALFMTLGQLPALEIVVWGRRWLWTCVAGGVLLAGMLTYFFSRGRLVVLVAALTAMALAATLIAPEVALNVSQYAGVGLLLFVAVAWSLRVGGAPIQRQQALGSASTVYRAEPRRSDAHSERRGSSLTLSNKAIVQTAAEEARS